MGQGDVGPIELGPNLGWTGYDNTSLIDHFVDRPGLESGLAFSRQAIEHLDRLRASGPLLDDDGPFPVDPHDGLVSGTLDLTSPASSQHRHTSLESSLARRRARSAGSNGTTHSPLGLSAGGKGPRTAKNGPFSPPPCQPGGPALWATPKAVLEVAT